MFSSKILKIAITINFQESEGASSFDSVYITVLLSGLLH